MKVAIISDTHDNLANIKKVVDWLNKEKINLLLHCGDVATLETLEEGFKDFPGEMHISLGNADIRHNMGPANFEKRNIISGFGEINIDNKKIAFTHFPEDAKKLAESEKYDMVFYGHDHRPGLKKIGNCRLVKSGEAAGIYNKATFAVYDTKTDKLELKIIERLD